MFAESSNWLLLSSPSPKILHPLPQTQHPIFLVPASMETFGRRSRNCTLFLVLCISVSLHITDAHEKPQSAKPSVKPSVKPSSKPSAKTSETPEKPSEGRAPACSPPFKTTGLPRFEAGECPEWKTLEDVADDVHCGSIIVAQDRHARGKAAGEVRMPVVRFCSEDRRNKDSPIIHLHGGPGGSSEPVAMVGGTISEETRRDVVLYDQRGGVFTQPALNCSSVTAECVKKLKNEGISINTFNAKEQAKDLEDIRIALGVKNLNLWGVSYGTELALQFSRDFPKSTRSLLLETSYWPEFGIFLANSAKSFDTVTQRVLKTCEESKECSRAFPRLRNSMDRILNFIPPKSLASLRPEFILSLFHAFNIGTPAYGGEKSPAPLFISLLERAIKKDLANKSIEEIDGNAPFKSPEGVLMRLINKTVNPGSAQDGLSVAATTIVNCYSEVSLYTEDRYERAVGKTRSRKLFEVGFKAQKLLPAQRRETCALLPKPSCPIDPTPVKHDIPTLVMSGTYDPVTPMEIGLKIAKTLSNARHMEVDGWGHGIISYGDACAISSYAELLKTSDMKQYKEPSCVRDRKLEFFTDASFLVEAGGGRENAQ